MTRDPDDVPRDIFPTVIPASPDHLSGPDSQGDIDGEWDPVGISMLARLYARSYLHAQVEPKQDE